MSNFPGAMQMPVRWWGYPTVHAPRRIKPTVLLVVHITGNSRLPGAQGEATYSNRDGSGASFTFVTNRDGTIVQCLQPETQTPWTNGDINKPNTAIPTVKAMVGSPYNPNEFCFMTCENVGYGATAPITAAQKETLARLLAWAQPITGLPINRSTVLGHRDINSVTRQDCPTSGDLNAFLNGIIARALEILNQQSESNTISTKTGATVDILAAYSPVATVSFPAGTYTGWKLDGTHKAGTLLSASSAHTSAKAVFAKGSVASGMNGTFLYIVDGIWAGFWVPAVGLEVVPAAVGVTQAQLDAAVAAQKAADAAALAAVTARLAGVKTKVAAVAADVAND